MDEDLETLYPSGCEEPEAELFRGFEEKASSFRR